MPTIILLDVSLSMSRPITGGDSAEETTQIRQLALHGINAFLDSLSTSAKLEYVCLVIFSSSWERVVPWTRDYSTIKSALTSVEEYNKTCLHTALNGVASICMEEWGCSTPCQVVLVTDGMTGVGEGSLRAVLNAHTSATNPAKLPLPFPFPSQIHVLCLGDPADRDVQAGVALYNKMIDFNGIGKVHVPEGVINQKNTADVCSRLAEKHFTPLSVLLNCGSLQCHVHVWPAPQEYDKPDDFEHIKKAFSSKLEICGFLNIADIGSPPYISRHLLLPAPPPPGEGKEEQKSEEEGEGENEDGKPTLTVLLHGSLKVGSMVALVQLAEDWYGILYSWADKKKSNLMLSVFKPGTNVLPWLGSLNHLSPIGDFTEPPYGDNDDKTPFPIRPADRRSYTQNCVVWIKNTGLQADIQKIIRNARKIPEKQVNFYKELNRLRRAALALGFTELLEAVGQLLERECQLLPGNSHPDAALQLTHAANVLRSPAALDLNTNITPLRTNFSGD